MALQNARLHGVARIGENPWAPEGLLFGAGGFTNKSKRSTCFCTSTQGIQIPCRFIMSSSSELS